MSQPIILEEADIVALLPSVDIVAALERMFRSLADGGAVQPAQTLSLFPKDTGDFITYRGVLADDGVFGAKLSPYIAGDGKALVTAWTLLMSMRTGQPVLLCDSKQLTTERTAATSIIAADALAPSDASILTIVGSGPVALAHLRYAERIRDWKEIRIASPNIDKRSDLPEFTKTNVPVRTYADADEAVAGADVVMLCTSSGTPVISAACLKTSAVVTSISTNVADAHEIDPSALQGFDVYCDYRATTPAVAGEMKLAIASGLWSSDALRGDLPELLSGKGTPPSRERPVFFRSVGLGLEDIAVAAALLSATRA
jgi:L-arginine dehydrogenase